jgi:O-Antigen ligase
MNSPSLATDQTDSQSPELHTCGQGRNLFAPGTEDSDSGHELSKAGNLMIGLLGGYIFLYIERPWEVWPVFGRMRVELWYMFGTTIVFFLSQQKRLFWHKLHLVFLAFLALHLTSMPFAYNPRAAQAQSYEYFKLVFLYFLFAFSIKNVHELRKILGVYVGVLSLYAAHSLREYLLGRHVYRMGIRRMVGVDQFANDPNTFAASLCLSLPIVWGLWKTTRRRAVRLALLAYGLLAMGCIMLTGSRTGALTLLLFGLILASHGKGIRRIPAALGLLLITVTCWLFLPDSLRNRLTTIWHPEVGPANAEASAEGRIEGLKAGMVMLSRKPLLGIGPGSGNFIPYRVDYVDGVGLQAHNLLGEVAGELGGLGLLLLVTQICLTLGTALNTRRSLSADRQLDEGHARVLASAFLYVLALLLFTGLSGHNFYRINWYWVASWVVVLQRSRFPD